MQHCKRSHSAASVWSDPQCRIPHSVAWAGAAVLLNCKICKASNLLSSMGLMSFPYCGPRAPRLRALLDAALSSYFGHPCKVANGQWHISEAEPCPTGESIKLDPKDTPFRRCFPSSSTLLYGCVRCVLCGGFRQVQDGPCEEQRAQAFQLPAISLGCSHGGRGPASMILILARLLLCLFVCLLPLLLVTCTQLCRARVLVPSRRKCTSARWRAPSRRKPKRWTEAERPSTEGFDFLMRWLCIRRQGEYILHPNVCGQLCKRLREEIALFFLGW